MEKRIYFLNPVFEAKYWGGQALRDRYGYHPDIDNIAIAYHVIALPSHHLDNEVVGTGMRLSEFYNKNRELFGCSREDFPVRMDSENNVELLSIQLHPNDAYCLEHEGERGKVECSILVQGDGDHRSIRGHNAQTREEFREMVEKRQWDKLLRVVEIKEGQYTYSPLGTIHGSPDKPTDPDCISLSFETNSDITYRLYDYDRNIANRPLHVEQVIDTVNIPDDKNLGVSPVLEEQEGCRVYRFLDQPGALTAFRVQVDYVGHYERPEFMFLFCIDGEADVNGTHVQKGETIFIPCDYGPVEIRGCVDFGGITYRE